ncbi:MAG: pyruvate dehydrogenase (acetyl-transferring) E1 component subunit alpha, partial [Patescibacteria group bacterium]
QKLIALQRQGRSGSYASIEGQEAAQIGSGIMLEKTDWIFPSFREFGISYVHGIPLEKLYLYWMGNEWGSNYDACVAPVSIPVGTHPLHAVGMAWAFKLQKKSNITVSYFGDGATSTGDVYEALNFAGALKVPTIFFCQNNHWAISTPRHKQTAAPTLVQKALAGGIAGVQVDGNDLFAVAAVTKEAADRARQGLGSTFIEAVTYRLGHHTTSDDSTRYRTDEEVKMWALRDPLLRMRKFMMKKNLLDAAFEEKIIADAEEKIRTAVEKAESVPPPAPEEMFDYLYETPTPELEEQKAYLLKFLNSRT